MLIQACIKRDVEEISRDPDRSTSHLVIICIWQKGADALIQQYKDLANSLPKASNLEVKVLTKEELLSMCNAHDQATEMTTYQINAICRNLSQQHPHKAVHLYVEECWITVSRRLLPHTTQVSCYPSLVYSPTPGRP